MKIKVRHVTIYGVNRSGANRTIDCSRSVLLQVLISAFISDERDTVGEVMSCTPLWKLESLSFSPVEVGTVKDMTSHTLSLYCPRTNTANNSGLHLVGT